MRFVRRVCAAAVACLMLAACTRVQSGGPQGSNAWTHHGVLRFANLSEPDTLNPIVGNQQVDTDLSLLWAGYLFEWNDRNEFVPDLATRVPTLENGDIARDGRTIVYHLRRGVKWHDGAPFSADDVIFTWRAVMNSANNVSSRTGYELITRIDKRDASTIAVHLKAAYAPFVASFLTMSSTAFPVLPAHLLAKYPDINRLPYNQKPVGTGPFVVREWHRGTAIIFDANPHFWRGAPKLREIRYEPISNDNTILTQLQTHELDMEYNAPSTQIKELRELPGTHAYLTPFTQYGQYAFNLRTPALTDVRVRQALAYATDLKTLNDDVAHGVNIAPDSISDQPPFLWAHTHGLKQYPYDPGQARKLLDAAGWVPGVDGIRTKGGRRLSLSGIVASGSALGSQALVLTQRQWHDVGVELQVKPVVSSLMFASYGAGGTVQTGKFDVAFFSWVNGVDPDDATLFMCDQMPPHGQNTYHWCDPAVDAAERIALTSNDRAVRKRAYDTVQQRLAAEVPLLPIWFTSRIDIVNSDLKNYRPAHAVTTFWNAYDWEL